MNNLNYGVIGNCRSAALISQKGSIDWCCLPEFDSPSVFAKILDQEKGGYFSFIVDDSYVITQKYYNWTNVLCTEFKSEQGSFEVIDFMPRYRTSDRDYFAPAEIFRFIRLKSGSPSLKVHYFPKLNYARDEVQHVIGDQYIRSFSKVDPTNCLFLYSSLEFNDILESREIELKESQFFLLSHNQKLINIDINRVYLEYQRTKVYWLNWTNRSKKYREYNDQIIRSLLVLKIMSYQSSGAVLAALTTSIPESIGEVRNWDYRFCWLRDASMSIDTLLKTGHYIAAQRFLGFIKGILKSKQDSFQIVYGIRGERELTELDLPHLSGYESSKPVRIGNAAYNQRQNDVFGYLMNVIHPYFEFFPGTLDEIEDMWEVVRNIARTVSMNWQQPDRGIWEMRYEEKHYVLSKVMSWVAMDRASKIASLLNKREYNERWRSTAIAIREDVLVNGWNEDLQAFTQTYGSPHLDASLLLMAEYGFMDADDLKYEKTVAAVKEALYHEGLLYRYVNNDDFGKPTSSFTICTFWLIQALYRIGRKEEAKDIFENLLACGNHVGLFSEDIDFATKRLLGNFPQAYSHLALINTALVFSDEIRTSKFIRP
ncbi:MAG: glycoside hydrolase [Bacteroidetes bacterium GWF2_49_14]|nr:MAG: glycoside hydrolase [Bacteroidetes bacterium GWF2_49_14]HBB93113.1 glycoside hydrolase family 15 protein [Bacteroidales bacterium]